MNRNLFSSPGTRAWACLAGTLALLGCAAPQRVAPPQSASASAAPAAPAAAPVLAAPAAPPPSGPSTVAAASAPPPPVQPFDEAVLTAANALLDRAQLPTPLAGMPYSMVIDPLIDGVTGMQSTATRAMGERIVRLIRERFPQYSVQPFTAANVQKSPLVLVGTFTGVNKDRKTEGQREAYRICLALADLKTGKLVSKGLAFAGMDRVDTTPLPFFRDTPAWTEDPATLGYIRTCQGTRAGDPIHPMYIDRIVAASLISEAMDAYAAGRFQEALDLYTTVLAAPAGNQLRAYSGLYLVNWRQGKTREAARAFGQIVNLGLDSKRLGVKFLFRPGSSAFFADPRAGATPYPVWLQEISAQAQKRQACLEVVGHSSPSGPEPINERLSLIRAEHVKSQLERAAPALGKRMVANGVGSRQTLVGTGRDDASDVLDRRVEFKVIDC